MSLGLRATYLLITLYQSGWWFKLHQVVKHRLTLFVLSHYWKQNSPPIYISPIGRSYKLLREIYLDILVKNKVAIGRFECIKVLKVRKRRNNIPLSGNLTHGGAQTDNIWNEEINLDVVFSPTCSHTFVHQIWWSVKMANCPYYQTVTINIWSKLEHIKNNIQNFLKLFQYSGRKG